jgi:hypothetical protein
MTCKKPIKSLAGHTSKTLFAEDQQTVVSILIKDIQELERQLEERKNILNHLPDKLQRFVDMHHATNKLSDTSGRITTGTARIPRTLAATQHQYTSIQVPYNLGTLGNAGQRLYVSRRPMGCRLRLLTPIESRPTLRSGFGNDL